MSVVDELASARSAYERGDWTTAFSAWAGVDDLDMQSGDLGDVALVAFLLGDRDRSVRALQRAFHLCVDASDPAGAVRCAFRLAMTFGTGGEPALFSGWLGRAERLMAQLPGVGNEPPVEQGYVAMLQMYRALQTGDFGSVAACAMETTEVGRQHGDLDLVALGVCSQGRMNLYAGQVSEGLALLDESMVSVLAGELSPLVAGHVYCTAIEGCQEIGDTGRVASWTSALHRWCTEQPGLVAFTGQCAVHRGQILTLRGAWPEALAEFADAVRRYESAGSAGAVGLAERERGDVLRLQGDLAGAEAAYQEAAQRGCDPQPGLALLWLAQGRTEAAVAALERALGEAQGPVPRSRLLPAVIEVLALADRLPQARERAMELAGLAEAFGTGPVAAATAQVQALLELASGDAAGSLPYARKAAQLWAAVDCPFEVARVRLLTGRALAAVGDAESSRQELTAARAAFCDLGAAPLTAEVEQLLSPAALPGGLTTREAEVLALVAAGRSNGQIADALVLSEKTVARHLSNIFTKLDVPSRTAAAAYAFEHHLV